MGRHRPPVPKTVLVEAQVPTTQPLKVIKKVARNREPIWKIIWFTIRRYVKGIVALLGAAGTTLAPLYIGDNYMDLPEQAQAVVAWLAALGVITVPNKQKRKK